MSLSPFSALKQLLKDNLLANTFYFATLSNPKSGHGVKKITVRPIQAKKTLVFQISEQHAEKMFHSNVDAKELLIYLLDQLATNFMQGLFCTEKFDYQLLKSKKGQVTLLKKKPSRQKALMEHNRRKNYILTEGYPIDFLVELGIMNHEGKIYPKKTDKFRQINRFLEIIADSMAELPLDHEISILDFGCGKSYLTFALYYYLQKILQIPVKLMGLDLKEEVIAFCSMLAKKLGYDNLTFRVGDINSFIPDSQVDVVICLHACDTATDAALENAVRWEAKVILAVPCCQHELFNQIDHAMLAPILRHGILKERFTALVTDAARAEILEMLGYRCQIIEFIDLEHTPKNLLIKALRSQGAKSNSAAKMRYAAFSKELQILPSLEKRFRQQLPIK